MDSFLLSLAVVFAMIIVYRRLSRRFTSPKARVAAMLRHYHTFAKGGLSEHECLFRLLFTRTGWKNLPQPFLREIVSRLDSKEDVMRFVSLSEGYRFDQTHIPNIAGKDDLDVSMTEIACLLTNFGARLQEEDRLKEAEFVQRLALKLQPKEYFTNLPLAATYFKMERYDDAVSLFKKGLSQCEKFEREAKPAEHVASLANCLGSNATIKDLRSSYADLYEACLKARGAPEQVS